MLVSALLTLATIAAIVATYTGIDFLIKCTALETHLKSTRPDVLEDKEGCYAWNRKRWAMDKFRTRTALINAAAYVVGMGSLLPVRSMFDAAGTSSFLPLIIMLVVSVDLALIGLRAGIHNTRVFEIDLKRQYPYSWV